MFNFLSFFLVLRRVGRDNSGGLSEPDVSTFCCGLFMRILELLERQQNRVAVDTVEGLLCGCFGEDSGEQCAR